tara:strand:- start:470 stop:1243 length:774 start_codon:yes stop_codon:yes gene_type:complete
MAYIKDDNGNYKRTVRCGHCYEIGHNKSACPQRKKDLVVQIETYTKELQNDDLEDWDRTYKQRYLARAQEDLHKMNNRGKNRRCGYCGEAGHTRRTCSDRKTDTDIKTRETIRLRKKAAERMAAAGFGPGALIETECYYTNDPVLAIITSIRMSDIIPEHQVSDRSYFRVADLVNVRYVTPVKYTWEDSFVESGNTKIPLDFMNVDEHDKSAWYRSPADPVKLISPVKIESEQLLPAACIDEQVVRKMVLEELVDPR